MTALDAHGIATIPLFPADQGPVSPDRDGTGVGRRAASDHDSATEQERL